MYVNDFCRFIGAGFVPTTGPPPKPAPPSFPTSPVTGVPVMPQVTPIQMVQPMASAGNYKR